MQFFAATFEQLTAYRELVRSQQEGVTPHQFPVCCQLFKCSCKKLHGCLLSVLLLLCCCLVPVLLLSDCTDSWRRSCRR